jgi:hypothetical protein
MKTTLNLDDKLLTRAKALARAQGTTLTRVVEEALRARLMPRSARRERFQLHVTTVRGKKGPAVDIADRNALFELLDQNP